MEDFHFNGKVPTSKSILNRALIIQSFAPEVRVVGDSQADDVRLMRDGLLNISQNEIGCGDAGTVLRFLALRISRLPGTHVLTGSERLFSRPQSELIPILSQLSIDAELKDTALKIRSR